MRGVLVLTTDMISVCDKPDVEKGTLTLKAPPTPATSLTGERECRYL
jgi:hypothetical protein